MSLTALGVVMAILGHLTHLVKKVVERQREGCVGGLVDYVQGRPYRTALGIALSTASMGYMIESGAMSAIGALTFGYMVDSGIVLLERRPPRNARRRRHEDDADP